jgi:large subunit ribosomal protein L18
MGKLTRDKYTRRAERKMRIRKTVSGTLERPRLVLYKSLKYLYAQIIDDSNQKTLIGCSTLAKDIKGKLKSCSNKDAAKMLGGYLGEKAKTKGIKKVVFDRNGYLFHGVVKVFADSVRETGIEF